MPFTFKLSKRLALMKASLVPAAAAVLAACQLQDRRGITGPTLPSNSVVQVVTSPDTVTLEPSVTQQFRAYGWTEAGDSVAITMTWSATDGAISSGGLYTAAPSQGDYEVTATVLQASTASSGTPQGVARGHSIVHVRSNPQLAQVVVVPRSVSLGTGTTQLFGAYGRLNNGDSVAVSVTWGAQGGTISSSGLYVAGSVPGGYVVTGTASGIAGTALLAVTNVSVASVAVSPASTTLSMGATQQLSATPKDAAGNVLTGRVITWASSNAAIASVSATGLVTGVAAGAVTITATSEGQSGTASVTVANAPVASVTVSPTAPNMYVGGTVQLTATPKDAAGNVLGGRTVTWTTSNGVVATVSASGLVTGVAIGAATITATSEGQSGTAAVTVSNVPVASVVLSPATASVLVGGTTQLSATPKDAAGSVLTGRVVTWASSNAAIATVSATGLVTGVAMGTVTITATSEGQSGTASVTVANVPVASVAISPSAPNMYVGTTVQLTATPKDAAGNTLTGRLVTWSSNNTSLAAVSANGLVTGQSAGSVTITATSEGQSATAAVTVSNVPVASVTVGPTAPNVYVGGTVQLTATPKDAAGSVLSGRVISWTSSNAAIATVSATGLVAGVAAGAATITATSEGKSGTASVTVANVPVASVTVSPTAPNVYLGGTVQLTATLKDASGNPLSGRAVTWTTSNGAVGTVSASGLVTGVAVGAATITATSEGQPGAAVVTVSNVPVASVVLTPTTANVFMGGTTQLSATPKDAAGNVLTGRTVTWTTSSSAVATVSASGLVTGIAAGAATITATSEGQSGTASVTVANVPVASVSVSPAAPNVNVGATSQLTATLKDASGNVLTGRTVTWTTSRSAVATVSASGLVTGVAVGAATITATSEGQGGTAAVTVSTVPVASLVVSPATATVVVGATTQLSATPKDAAGNVLVGRAVTWTISNPAIATVSSGGLVTGVAAGAATITATSEGQSGTASVTVANVPVASVVITPATAVVLVGATVQLAATLKDAAGNVLSGRSVTWTSSAPTVAPVSSTGLVTGVSAAAVTITATGEGKSGTAAVTVNLVPVASVSVSPTSAGVPLGQWVQLTAMLLDANGMPLSGRSITWASSVPAVAAVSSGGLVTGVAAGAATITATSEGQSGTAAITVTAPVSTNAGTVTDLGVAGVTDSSVTLSFTEVTDGTGLPASYDVRYAAGAISWGSAPSVTRGTCATPMAGSAIGATRSCTVLGLAAGKAYSFQLVAFRGTLNVNAVFGALSNVASGTTAASTAPVASVTVSPATASVAVGQTLRLTATPKDASGTSLSGRVVTWASSNTAVAMVSGSGLVTGVAAGTATITATSEGVNGTAVITVTVTAPPPSGTWPSEPTGFTLVNDYDLGSDPVPATNTPLPVGSAGWRVQWNSSGYGAAATDATAPLSPPAVYQVTYPIGFTAGSAPATLYYNFPAPYKEVYFGFWWKPSNPWQNEPSSSVNKIAFLFPQTATGGVGGGSLVVIMYGTGSGFQLAGLNQCGCMAAGTHTLPANVASPTAITLGTWHRVEWYAKYSTTASSADGVIRWWLDGVLQGSYTNQNILQDAGFVEASFSPTWGGLGSTKTETDYYWYDHVHISRR